MDSLTWKGLVEKKEKEWRDILESRIESQDNLLKEREKDLQTQRAQFNELKDHFKFNLKLLEERDRELEKYDVNFVELRTKLNEKNAELSDVKIHIDDLKNVIEREQKTRDELQSNYQRRLREKQAEVDQYKSSKDQEVQSEREEYEQFRCTLQLQLTNVQTELDIQKRELTTEFENELKKREHEWRVTSDEHNAKALELDLKVKLLEKELELTRESNDKTNVQMEEAEIGQRELEKLVKQKEWELADISAVKDSQISELENKLSSAEASEKKMREDFQRKYTEMDRMGRDREEMMERAKAGYLERENLLQAKVQELQSKLEDAQIKEKQLTWTNQDLAKEKDIQIEKMQEELQDVKERWDRHVAEMSQDNVSRDLELANAREEQRKLKVELEQRKEDLNRYKLELQRGAQREESLDKAKTQTELNWQRRCEDLERQQYDKAEDLIKSLINARNEAQALAKERERELTQQKSVMRSLQQDSKQLKEMLREHNIPLDGFVQFSPDELDHDQSSIDELQLQNTNLKQLIGQMRAQIETLGQSAPDSGDHDMGGQYQEDLWRLRKENKELQRKLQLAGRIQYPAPQTDADKNEIMKHVEGNTHVKSHILALNETIGALRAEKVEMGATVRKQQARLVHLEHSLEELSKQPREKQIQIDQLTYQLTSQRRHNEGEITTLKSRVTELELQLSEARREADEYHRVSLERNHELVAMGNQLSALKMEAADANPSINFGAQELYIQQLQGELSQLRKRATALETSDHDALSNKFATLGDSGSNKADLRFKLKSAAAKIVQLATENQLLIESNNKLRAQLKAAGESTVRVESKVNKSAKEAPVESTNESSKEVVRSKAAADRLSQLEKLQYQLTIQELQYASRFTSDGPPPPPSDQMLSQNLAASLPEKDEPSVHRASSQRDAKMLTSMSSGGGESIHRVWQMLEDSLTSGDLSPRSVIAAGQRQGQSLSESKDTNFQVEGRPVSTSQKPERKVPSKLSEDPRKLVKPRARARNYNIKDNKS